MTVIVDMKKKSVRSAAILTASYVAGTVLETKDYNQLVLLVSFTIGSLTTAEIKVEFSADGSTYYQETFSAISTGTSTDTLGVHSIAATGNYRIVMPICDAFVKVSVKGTGTVTNSSMTVDAILGVV